jgi:ferritin
MLRQDRLKITLAMPKAKISAKVVEELNRQLNQELGAAHSYQALSVWCEVRNLPGFAAYFAKQAGEERAHAAKIQAHMIDRDLTPELGGLPAPRQEFKTLMDVALHAQGMEQANTQGINAVFEAALVAKDYPAQVLMHWFINEQVEEEAWCSEMVDRVQSASCSGGLSSLDRHLDRYLAPDAKAAGEA